MEKDTYWEYILISIMTEIKMSEGKKVLKEGFLEEVKYSSCVWKVERVSPGWVRV